MHRPKRFAYRGLAAVIGLAIVLYAVHLPSQPTMMDHMASSMPQSICQSSCGSGLSPTVQIAVAPPSLKIDEQPQPVQPYYISFVQSGWILVIFIAAALMYYRRLKPPDRTMLFSVYRF